MFRETLTHIKIAFMLLMLFTLFTGLIYPAIVTGIAQALFPWEANGSLIQQNGKIIGSLLIGQSFSDPNYFWSRPSATTPTPYNAENSSGSNFGPSNPIFLNILKDRVEKLRHSDPKNQTLVPGDLITASGSGLDPDISPMAAYYQVPRVAKARGLSEIQLLNLIQNLTINRSFGMLGEPRVNVLQLNLALSSLHR